MRSFQGIWFKRSALSFYGGLLEFRRMEISETVVGDDQMKYLSVKFLILLLLVLTFGCSSISQLTKDGIGQPISTVTDLTDRLHGDS